MFSFERDRDRVWVGEGQREEDTESEAGSRLQAVSTEPDMELKPTNQEIMTWAEVGGLTDWATQAHVLLMWCITCTDLGMSSHPRVPGINPTCSWRATAFVYGWTSFADVLLKVFASAFIRDAGPWLSSFLVMSLSGVGVRVMLTSGNQGARVPSSSVFLEGFKKDWR